MRSYILLAMSLAIGSSACASEHGMHYTILIDSSIDANQVEAAGAEWESAVPGLSLDYVKQDCRSYGNSAHTVCVFLDMSIPAIDSTYKIRPCATTDWSHGFLAASDSVSADSATIHLWNVVMSSEDNDSYINVIAHEIGHSLTHNSSHIGSGNLMAPTSTGDVVEAITESDVEYFWNAR